jgi:hypothetical protein
VKKLPPSEKILGDGLRDEPREGDPSNSWHKECLEKRVVLDKAVLE